MNGIEGQNRTYLQRRYHCASITFNKASEVLIELVKCVVLGVFLQARETPGHNVTQTTPKAQKKEYYGGPFVLKDGPERERISNMSPAEMRSLPLQDRIDITRRYYPQEVIEYKYTRDLLENRCKQIFSLASRSTLAGYEKFIVKHERKHKKNAPQLSRKERVKIIANTHPDMIVRNEFSEELLREELLEIPLKGCSLKCPKFPYSFSLHNKDDYIAVYGAFKRHKERNDKIISKGSLRFLDQCERISDAVCKIICFPAVLSVAIPFVVGMNIHDYIRPKRKAKKQPTELRIGVPQDNWYDDLYPVIRVVFGVLDHLTK
jgi:hypothetical protein